MIKPRKWRIILPSIIFSVTAFHVSLPENEKRTQCEASWIIQPVIQVSTVLLTGHDAFYFNKN